MILCYCQPQCPTWSPSEAQCQLCAYEETLQAAKSDSDSWTIQVSKSGSGAVPGETRRDRQVTHLGCNSDSMLLQQQLFLRVMGNKGRRGEERGKGVRWRKEKG